MMLNRSVLRMSTLFNNFSKKPISSAKGINAIRKVSDTPPIVLDVKCKIISKKIKDLTRLNNILMGVIFLDAIKDAIVLWKLSQISYE